MATLRDCVSRCVIVSGTRDILTEITKLTELPCWSVDPGLFFAESPADVQRAKALCKGCPVRQPCLAGALERREPWGVWGGKLFAKGLVIPIKRGRGRPRKDATAPARPRRAA